MMNNKADKFNLQYDAWRFNALVCGILCCATLFACLPDAFSATITEKDLKDKVAAASKDFRDLSMTVRVVDVDRTVLDKFDSNYARLMELKSTKVSLKFPDKMKIEGKLGMVKFEYIINGGIKLSRAPNIHFKRRDDYSNDPAKLQGPFDIGLVTLAMWHDRKIEVVDDQEATANGEIKIRLRWAKSEVRYFAWLDAKDLWLKRMEKRDEQDVLRVRLVYSNPKNIVGALWMPTTLEMYASDERRVGKTETSDVKCNIGLLDSLFQ